MVQEIDTLLSVARQPACPRLERIFARGNAADASQLSIMPDTSVRSLLTGFFASACNETLRVF